MAGTKGLRTIAEALDATKRVARGVDVSKLDPASGSGTLGALTRNLDEYEEVAGSLERANQAPATPQAVRVEIARREAVAAEDARVAEITSTGTPSTVHQTRTPEEFDTRLRDQLEPGVPQNSRTAHTQTVDQVLSRLKENPRWTARTEDWTGDSPYSGDVMFHVDRISDPTRSNSFIQFEEPREMGLHMGTNAAAEGAIRPGVDEALRLQQQQQEALEQVANEMDIPLQQLERQFAQVSTDHFRSIFQGGREPAIWDEIESILDKFTARIGANQGQTRQFVQGLKSLPQPNTTPLLFRGRNGLLLEDNGNFNPNQVATQLQDIFNSAEDFDGIEAALQGGRVESQKGLQAFIESKGFDHIVYRNSVEDKGSLSIINWNPELQRVPWDPEFTRGNPTEAAKAATAFVMAMLGVGGAVTREEK